MEVLAKTNVKNKFGQYFTPRVVAEFMIGLAEISSSSSILEPSCGEGIFLDLLQKKGYKNIVAYEIDDSLARDFSDIRYESFISAQIEETFDLVIGNPPYIRWKNLENVLKAELEVNPIWNKYFNSLCDYLYIFILKSIELLNEEGQLIFICPEYWMNTTHSASLRNYMVQNGYFEEIYHFNETPIFDDVTVSIIIFKYRKSKNRIHKVKVTKFHTNRKLSSELLGNLQNRIQLQGVEYIDIPPFKVNQRWLLQSYKVISRLKKLEFTCQKVIPSSPLNLFEEQKSEYHTIGEICDIGNGLVSGLDKAFRLNGHKLNNAEKTATVDVAKAKDLAPFFVEDITKYILIRDSLEEAKFQEIYPNYFLHFQKYKADLENRYQYDRKINYWEWVFLRNYKLFSKPIRRILVPCKERISNRNYFRFALADANIFPTQDVTAIFKKPKTLESIEYILAYLNQPIIFDWLKCNGIVKGNIVEFSERPIASIPFKKIDWNNEREIALHNSITLLTKQLLLDKKDYLQIKIKQQFKQLLDI
jgi:adenine-specific DNA-methyltransferase